MQSFPRDDHILATTVSFKNPYNVNNLIDILLQPSLSSNHPCHINNFGLVRRSPTKNQNYIIVEYSNTEIETETFLH